MAYVYAVASAGVILTLSGLVIRKRRHRAKGNAGNGEKQTKGVITILGSGHSGGTPVPALLFDSVTRYSRISHQVEPLLRYLSLFAFSIF